MKFPPWMASLEPSAEDESAIKAWARGEATESQQQRAFKFVVEVASNYYDLSFKPDSPRGSDFCEGRRYVGAQLVRLAKRVRKKDVGRKSK